LTSGVLKIESEKARQSALQGKNAEVTDALEIVLDQVAEESPSR
jgi:hypothetical protein